MQPTGFFERVSPVWKTDFENARQKVDAALDRQLPSLDGFGGRLHEAMRYSVFSGGKRLRPCLCLLVNQCLDGREEDALPAACALELVHTYSLIHDDLPAMDDDDFRRGKPSCHMAFDEATAVLAGDALLTLAFEVIAGKTPEKKMAASLALVLAEAAGAAGMVLGQMRDLLGERKEPEIEKVRAIHEAKTAAMIRSAFEIGAISAGADTDTAGRMAEAGEWIGLVFQVIDDILDIESTSEQLGKTAGKDILEGKMTYPAAIGLDASRTKAKEMTDTALDLLVPKERFEPLREMVLYMLNRNC